MLIPLNTFVAQTKIITTMKKLIFSAILVLTISMAATAQSENYKPFKVDLGAIYGLPMGSEVFSAGGGIYLEPKYNVTDNVAAGIRLEWAFFGAVGENVSASAWSSYLGTCDYYVGTEGIRPYFGGGLGIYKIGRASVGPDEVSAEVGTKFGFVPRAGLLLGHFRTGLEYNIVTGIKKANYLSLKIGFEIGGGKL